MDTSNPTLTHRSPQNDTKVEHEEHTPYGTYQNGEYGGPNGGFAQYREQQQQQQRVNPRRRRQPPPVPLWRRIVSWRGLVALVLLWLVYRFFVPAKKEPEIIYATRYSKEFKYRPAASPIITETLKDGRIRIRGADQAAAVAAMKPTPTPTPKPKPKRRTGTKRRKKTAGKGK